MISPISKLIVRAKIYYQTPFRKEMESGFGLIFYKIFTKFIGFTYTAYHFKSLISSRNKSKTIKKSIVDNEKNAFVFANGPSLSDIDLGKVRKLIEGGEYDLIAVNSFLSKSSSEIMPTFAVFSDNLHFNVDDKDSQYSKDVSICKEKNIKYFVPFKYYQCKSSLQIGYNAFCEIFSKNTSNILNPPGFYGLTALHALRVAKHLGYKNIYICGFDNSYFKDFEVGDTGEMVIRHRHYYDGKSNDVEVPCLYERSSEFFFDTYRHFHYIEKITKTDGGFLNVALHTYLSSIRRDLTLDIYKSK